MKQKWIGVDFDHTLARGDLSPVDHMVIRVLHWLNKGIEVRIVTARVNDIDHSIDEINENIEIITSFCLEYFGRPLAIQSCKSSGMIELWDDKVVPVVADKGTVRCLNLEGCFDYLK